MSDFQTRIHLDIDAGGSIVELQRLQNEVNRLNRTLSNLGPAASQDLNRYNQALMQAANSSGLFQARLVPVTTSVENFTNKLEKNKLTLTEYTKYAGSQLPGLSRIFKDEFATMQRVAEDRVRKIATQYVALGEAANGAKKAIALTPTGALNLKDQNTQAAIAAQRHALLNKVLSDGSTKMLNWGKNTQWAGRQLMVGFSIPLAMLGTAAARTFAELDKASISFRRVYGDLNTTTAEMERNLEAVKSLGKEYTKYGVAVSDTIDLSARAAATGAQNESLMAATEETLRLAALGQMDYNTALDATISLQTAFKVSNEDLKTSIDFLNAVENQTVLTLQDMAVAIPRVAPVVKGLGGDVRDLAVFMTAMREGGVSAEQGANALKSGLASLINPTKRAQETLAKFQINLNSIIASNRGDLMGIITEFAQALSGLDEFSQQQALEQIFGKYQYARMGALFKNIINDSGQAARAMDLAAESAENLGALADKELGKIAEATSTKFTAAMEQLKLAISPLGEQFMKVATPILEFASKLLDKFNNLPDGIKNFAVVATAALAGLGPIILMSVGLLANGLANITKGVLVVRKGFQRLTGSAKSVEYLATAELEAATATSQLESRVGSLTSSMMLQQSAIRTLISLYDTLAASASRAAGTMPSVVGGGRTVAPIKRAKGGLIPGTGNKDTVPALLTPGESVVTKKATRQYGPIIDAMNNGTLQKFALGGKVMQSMRSVLSATKKNPLKSYAGSPRKAPSPFQTMREYFGKDIPESVIQTAFQIGGGAGKIDRRVAKRYARTAIAHVGKATRHNERKAWTAQGTRLTATGENEALQNIFSSKERKNIAYQLFAGSDLKGSKYDKDIRDIIFGGYHPTSKSQYEAADMLLGLLASDKNFMQSLQTKRLKEQLFMLRGFTKIRTGNHNYDLSKLGQDPYSIWSGEAKNMGQLIRGELKGIPEPIKRAQGGLIPGKGNKDTVPALLTPGESVVTKEATAKYAPIISAMNAGTLRGFQDGETSIGAEAGHFTRAQRVSDISEVRRIAEESKAAAQAAGRSVSEWDDILNAITEGKQVEAKLYTNAIANIPRMANKDQMTGTEFGAMLASSAGRTRMMDPFIDQMAKELGVSAGELRRNSSFMKAIDEMATEVGTTLASKGGDFVRTKDFNDAFNNAIDAKIQSGQFTQEEAAAFEKVRTRKTRGQFYVEGRKVGGRKALASGVVPYRTGGYESWEDDFLTEEGNERRRVLEEQRAARKAQYEQSQTSRTKSVEQKRRIVQASIQDAALWDLTNKERKAAKAQAEEEARFRSFVREEDKKEFIRKRQEQIQNKQMGRSKAKLIAQERDFLLSRGVELKTAKRVARKNVERGILGSRTAQQRAAARTNMVETSVTSPEFLGMPSFPSQDERQSRRQRTAKALGKFGRVSGRIGGALGMASIIPFMAQDEQGKFLGADANMLGTGMMAAGLIGPMAGPLINGIMAHPAIAALTVAASVAGVALYKWRDSIDSAARESAKLGANIGGTSNALNNMAALLGEKTPAQRRTQMALGMNEEQQRVAAEQFGPLLESEQGQKFIKELKDATSADRFSKLSDYLKSAIASGLMDAESANLFAKTIASSLSDPVLGAAVLKSISGQRTGAKAMLELAQGRAIAVSGSEAARALAGATGQIGTDTAASVVGSSIQVIQDFSNAAALAREQFAAGAISYDQYKNIIDQSTEAQRKYTQAIEDAFSKTQDIGATMQAWKDQMLMAGFTEEDTTKIEEAARYLPESISRVRGSAAAMEKSGKLVSNEKLIAAQTSSIISGALSVAQAEIVTKAVRENKGMAAQSFRRTQDLEMAALGYNIDQGAVPGLNYGNRAQRAAGKGQYMATAEKFKTAGFDMQTFQQIMAMTREENTIPLSIELSGMSQQDLANTVGNIQKMQSIVGPEGTQLMIDVILAEDPPNLEEKIPTLTRYMREINEKVPNDVQKQLGINLTSKEDLMQFGTLADDLAALVPILDKMPQGVREFAINMMIQENGKVRSAKSFLDQTASIKTAFANLSSKNKKVKKEAIIDLMTIATGPNGEKFSNPIEAYTDMQKRIDQQFGAGSFNKLPADTYIKTINLQLQIQGLEEALQAYRDMAALGQQVSPDRAEGILQRLQAAQKAQYGEAGAGLSTVEDKKKEGGGGGKQKSFVEQLLIDTEANLKLIPGKINQLKKMVPNLPQSLIEMIGMGEQGLKNAEGLIGLGKKKLVQLVKDLGTVDLRQALQGIDAQWTQQTQNITARQKLESATVDNRKVEKDVLEAIMNDENARTVILKGNSQEIENTVRLYRNMREATNVIDDEIKKITLQHEDISRGLEKQIKDQEAIVEEINKQIDALDQKNEEDNRTIQQLNRQKEMIQRQVEVLERANEMDQRRIETLNRQTEIREREADALSHDLDIMSRREEEIRAAYEKRINALDEVAKINDYIINQQKSQLGLSQALSQGDIYAAAQAAQEIQAQQVQFATEQQRTGLEQSMENQIAGLTTEGGLTREQAEERIRQIREQSYQTSLLIRDIEDQIYARNQEMIPLKDQQYSLDQQIQVVQDRIYVRENEIYDIRKKQLEPQQIILDNLQKEKTKEDEIFNAKVESLELAKDLDDSTIGMIKNVDELAKAWYKVKQQIDGAQRKAADARTQLGEKPEQSNYNTAAAWRNAVNVWQGKMRAIDATEAAEVNAAMEQGKNALANAKMYAGGMVARKYAVGGVAGAGGRDSVSAMLTPGEFVMRKAAVKKYGMTTFEKMNMGAFTMPQYNMDKDRQIKISSPITSNNVVAPVYNSYSINVPVTQPNASADEIANRVMMRIRNIENSSIRGINGY